MVTRIVIGIKVYTCPAYRFSQVRSFRCEQFCTGTVPYFLMAVQAVHCVSLEIGRYCTCAASGTDLCTYLVGSYLYT